MKPTLLCLHGWGGSKASFDPLRAALAGTDITVLSPDLPGFGSEPEPSQPWTNDDFADWAEAYAKKSVPAGSPLHLLGHSHGGRIAIKLAVRKSLPIHHLYLCAAAGIRHPRHFKRILGLTLAKSGKFFLSIPGLRLLQLLGQKFLYKLVRVHDYEKADPVMRETMILVTRENLRPLLEKINLPTDIFWGEDDGMTPVGDAKEIQACIQGSELHLYPGVRHKVHQDRAAGIAAIIRTRIGA